MKSIVISIRPKWVAKILNGEKTIEIRKTAPKCYLPVEIYIYCTKGDYIGHISNKYVGKVVAKFSLSRIGQYIDGCSTDFNTGLMFGDAEHEGIYEKACLTHEDINEYCPDESFYAWHISGLLIFDKPKDLSEFGLAKPPQSWRYVEKGK